MRVLGDFLELFFPNYCYSCGDPLDYQHQKVCIHCMAQLPLTGYSGITPNPVEQLFWGKVEVEHATALFHFSKNSRIQHLTHQLKYHGKKDLGILLGQMLGDDLKKSPFYKDIDFIVPVPLHISKKNKRGYNQSEEIAKGISLETKIEVNTSLLSRSRNRNSQTDKKRWERWENIKDAFIVNNDTSFEAKHILVVDDVITTGSTLTACIEKLSVIPGIRISIAALAFSD